MENLARSPVMPYTRGENIQKKPTEAERMERRVESSNTGMICVGSRENIVLTVQSMRTPDKRLEKYMAG